MGSCGLRSIGQNRKTAMEKEKEQNRQLRCRLTL